MVGIERHATKATRSGFAGSCLFFFPDLHNPCRVSKIRECETKEDGLCSGGVGGKCVRKGRVLPPSCSFNAIVTACCGETSSLRLCRLLQVYESTFSEHGLQYFAHGDEEQTSRENTDLEVRNTVGGDHVGVMRPSYGLTRPCRLQGQTPGQKRLSDVKCCSCACIMHAAASLAASTVRV